MKKTVIAFFAVLVSALITGEGWATQHPIGDEGENTKSHQKTRATLFQESFEFNEEVLREELDVAWYSHRYTTPPHWSENVFREELAAHVASAYQKVSRDDLDVFYASAIRKCVKHCRIISCGDAALIFQALLENPLESLTIQLHIWDDGSESFMKVFSKNLSQITSLQSLTLTHVDCDVSTLNTICQLPQLKQFSLDPVNYWREEEEKFFFESLSQNSTVTILKLFDCGIKRHYVFDMLQKNRTLTNLLITGGATEALSDAHFPGLQKALKINLVLKELTLENHFFTAGILPLLEETLTLNTTLEKLSLTNAFCDDDDNIDIEATLNDFQERSQIKCKILYS